MKLILMLVFLIAGFVAWMAGNYWVMTGCYLLGVAFFVAYLWEDEPPEEIIEKCRNTRKL